MTAGARARAWLATPVDVASLAAFRIAFGAVMCVAALRTLARGWVGQLYVAPAFHFSYPHLDFVRPWPGAGMYVHFAVMALAALGVAVGFRHRLCAAVYFLTFTYAELIDRALYLNHYYLVSLLAAWLIVLPAAGAFSIDAWRRPQPRVTTLPGWALAALRAQVGVVYFFAGIAKLNRDWLADAQPLRIWLAARSDLPVAGPWLALPAVAFAASWAAAAFDLTIVGFLVARRTRAWAFAAVVVFHLATGLLFPIGMFPWIMIASATLFFAPDWPRRFSATAPIAAGPTWTPPRALAPIAAAHLLLQIALPLRQHLAREPSAWSVRGFNFAWNVMVAEKAGHVRLAAVDRRSGQRRAIDPARYLQPFQERAMAQDPQMIRALAQHAAHALRGEGHDVAIYVDAVASLNGRPAQVLIDPRVDLTGDDLPEQWIRPLE